MLYSTKLIESFNIYKEMDQNYCNSFFVCWYAYCKFKHQHTLVVRWVEKKYLND